MGIIEMAAIVAAIALVGLTCFAVPVLLELKKTLIQVKQLATDTDERIKPLLQDVHDTLDDLKRLASDASDRVEEVKTFTEAVSETGRHVRSINTILGAATSVVSNSAVWMTGAKVAGKFVIDRFSKKRGK